MLVDVTFVAPKLPERTLEATHEVKLYVLQQLIRQGEDGAYVWLADQSDGVARKTRIEPGAIGSSGLVGIVSGLTVSSRIISGGTDGLQDGDRIRVTGEDPTLGTKSAVDLSSKSTTPNRQPTGDNQ